MIGPSEKGRGAWGRCLLVALASAVWLPAQSAPDQDLEMLRSLRERLAAAERREAQLFDARIQLDLGLQVRSTWFEPTPAEREMARFEGPERLDAERAALARLARRHAGLEERAFEAREAARSVTEGPRTLVDADVPDRSELEELVARARAAAAAQREEQRAEALGGEEDAAPTGQEDLIPTGGPERPAVFVHGSRDGSALGFALLRAGNRLSRDAERAERGGDAGRAGELRAAAAERFEDARASFESLRDQDLATVRELFGLACALEKLGDLVAADSRYVEVMALDQETAPDGSQTYGPWGRAAQTARTVMRWMDDNRGWKPRRDPEEIPLPVR